ncbi:tyrosine--tRNA ligase [uncultured Propionibacterium sp.]|uniref:tyrosine--tRNA ligase n=1 Tax=uncultured Propionibacterium sp. TaxID=218066 RepID=UPI00292DACFD|nr:tyrosine--tRNA ligase [uncultured Propionibacterium sp.]
MNALLDDLTWRGFVSTTTDEAALAAHLDGGMVTSYVGFDPTAPSLHIGHLMQLILARRLQEAGHRPLLLVGGATGLIGDPKMTGERVMNTRETVAGWVESLRSQVSRFVSFEGENASQIVNNLDWTAPLPALDFLRDIGRHFSVNRMLARDVVARRLDEGISYTEFSYVLLQSLDYAALHERYGCTLQTGAQDQWGNITAGIDYIRRTTGDVVHGLVTPLLTKADGTKFGKTEGGAIWLDPGLTSPYAFHQFWLNAEDASVVDYLKIFSARTRDEIDELETRTRQAPSGRAAQHALANDITDLVHGRAAREAAEAAAAALFGRGDLGALNTEALAMVMGEIGAVELAPADGRFPSVVDALAASGVVPSKSAARRAVAEGGAYLNNRKVTDVEARLTEDELLAGRYAVVRRGKRTVGGVIVP